MVKQVWRFCMIALISLNVVHAHAGGPAQILSQSSNDTTAVKKDSTKIEITALKDPKENFKGLFITEESSGYSLEQLNPLAISFVEDYMSKNGKMMTDLKGTGKPYFDMMDAILEEHGLPKELKYLAVIESQLKTNARSWAGAVGPWQFMPTTARTMGLKITRKMDERRDIRKSTQAASKYLSNLYELYGDWLLVIAAYNGGPGTVNSAIKKSGSRDFWSLQKYLPAESRNHVKKFIATHYIMEGEGGITTLTKGEAQNLQVNGNNVIKTEELADTKLQAISGRYNSSIILKHISMELAAFNKINPNFDKVIAANGTYDLRLPADKMNLFLDKKTAILSESVQLLLSL